MSPVKPYFGGKAPKPIPFNPIPYMEEWLENLEADEISIPYIRSSRLALAYFSIFAESEGIKHPDEIKRAHILRFQAFLSQRRKEDGDPLSLAYRQQVLKHLRAWINWLERLDYITTTPWVRIRVGTVQKIANPLEEQEIELLFDAHRQQAFLIKPFFYHRRETILVLLYGWGLRLNELASLTVTSMDSRLDYVVVRNKSRPGSASREKSLPYSAEMKLVVQRYLVHRGNYGVPGEDALFVDQQGAPMTAHHIRKIITECGKRAGVTINPHRLRDTYATTLLDADVPVERIMRLLGHTRREQTLAYARLNDPKLKESHDAVMNPLLHRLIGGKF